MANSMKQFVTNVLIPILFILCILLSLPLVCGHGHDHGHGHAHDHGHGHAHDHGHGHAHHGHEEPPSFKWSRQANEPYVENENEEELKSHGHIHSHGHGHSHGHEENLQQPQPKSGVWLEAIGATLLISIAPYIILFFVPVTNAKEHEPYLKVLLAFASGGLLGDAFLHLIPHALSPHGSGDEGHTHSHAHSHGGEDNHGNGGHDMSIGLAVLGGIIAFLIVEKFVRIFKGGHSHSHSHDHGTLTERMTEDEAKKKDDDYKADEDNETKKAEVKNDTEHNEEGDIKVAGYLNLAADFTHNLTDGLAIGASFLAGKNIGIVTTITIFLHEIPHEIGDFAILLQSGCSRQKAMKLQLVTALGALTGCLISLLAEGADESAISWILPFTAGGFIYIATVSVIPELLENTNLKQSVAEVLALLTGVGLMMGIAHVEEMGHEH